MICRRRTRHQGPSTAPGSVTARGAQALPDRGLQALDVAMLVGDDLQPAAPPRSARRAPGKQVGRPPVSLVAAREGVVQQHRPHRPGRGATGTAGATGNWSRSPRRTGDPAGARARPPGPPRPARAAVPAQILEAAHVAIDRGHRRPRARGPSGVAPAAGEIQDCGAGSLAKAQSVAGRLESICIAASLMLRRPFWRAAGDRSEDGTLPAQPPPRS